MTEHPDLTCDLNAGYSFGLQHPVVYGWRPDRDLWMAWDRRTGQVHAALPPNRNAHGYDCSKNEIKKLAEPPDYYSNPFEQDDVS